MAAGASFDLIELRAMRILLQGVTDTSHGRDLLRAAVYVECLFAKAVSLDESVVSVKHNRALYPSGYMTACSQVLAQEVVARINDLASVTDRQANGRSAIENNAPKCSGGRKEMCNPDALDTYRTIVYTPLRRNGRMFDPPHIRSGEPCPDAHALLWREIRVALRSHAELRPHDALLGVPADW